MYYFFKPLQDRFRKLVHRRRDRLPFNHFVSAFFVSCRRFQHRTGHFVRSKRRRKHTDNLLILAAFLYRFSNRPQRRQYDFVNFRHRPGYRVRFVRGLAVVLTKRPHDFLDDLVGRYG